MLIRFCDICKTSVVVYKSILMPRRVPFYAKSAVNETKLAKFEHYQLYKTDLCDACFNRIANMFPEVEEDECEMY